MYLQILFFALSIHTIKVQAEFYQSFMDNFFFFLELRQSAEGVDVLPDILGDGGGGGDGSSGNNSDADDGGPAGKKGINSKGQVL